MAHYHGYQRTDGSIQQRILPLLTPIWEDHEVNDISLLKADTFSWQNGSVYQAVYQHLESDIFGKTLQRGEYIPGTIKQVGTTSKEWNGVLSNFSANNYFRIIQDFTPGDYSWEKVFKVKTGNDVNTLQIINGTGTDHRGCYFTIKTNKFTMNIADGTTTTWNIGEIQSINNINGNTDYYLKAEFTGTAYNFYISNDGINYTLQGTVSSSVKIPTTNLWLGMYGVQLWSFFGSIDLKESYVKINEEYWWKPNVDFYLANDGHKICPASEESNVNDLFISEGVAWYYIIDTDNERFKLPRSTYNKYSTELPVKGNGMAIGLTDGTDNVGLAAAFVYGSSNTSLIPKDTAYNSNVGTTISGGSVTTFNNKTVGLTTDSTKSGIIVSSIADTGMKLYFYVGEFTQSAMANTAGINAETLNDKLSKTDVTDRQTVIGWGMPDYANAESITNTYTATKDGYVLCYTQNGYAQIFVNSIQVAQLSASGVAEWLPPIPVSKNDVITFTGTNIQHQTFIPCKGAN